MNQRNLRIEAIVPENEANPSVGELTFLNNEVDVSTGTIFRLRQSLPTRMNYSGRSNLLLWRLHTQHNTMHW
ncbi:MAG: hypothetical protein U0586_02805 [Candidatus Brocadiaceae bacterium]